MTSPFLGEFLGTMILILLGDGVVAGVLLKRSKAEGSGWIVITAGWAFAVRAGSFGKCLPYVAAQLLGAMAGATLVWVHYLPHWKETPDAGLKLACFCTGPAIRNAAANLISEIIGTAVLVFVVGAIFSKAIAAGGPGALGPYLVASLVWGIGLSLGGTTGYAINPARDLGPRLAHAILPIAGKGGSDWSYAGIPVVGPLLGGALAGWFLRILNVS